MDEKVIRESVPIGDVCSVYEARAKPGMSATIVVAMERSGGVSQHYDIEMPKAVELARKGVLTWVDHTTSDLKSAADVAMGFGFSREMMDSLESENLSEYVDRDSELGLKIRRSGWSVRCQRSNRPTF